MRYPVCLMWVPRFLRRRPSVQTFVPFLCVVLLWNVAFGGLKFLIKNLTVSHLDMVPGVLLEHVVLYLSIGCVLSFLLGGCVCHAMRKRTLVFLTAVVAIGALLVEYFFGLSSEATLAITSMIIGICFGLFSVARAVISCFEIRRTQWKDTAVNGTVMVTVITATIVGAFVSTRMFELIGVKTLWVFLGFFALICLISHWMKYGEDERIIPFGVSLRRVKDEFLYVFKHRSMILVPSAALWAISLIVGIKAVGYVEQAYGVRESFGALILLCNAAGAIVGNALTLQTSHRRRWLWFRIATYAFAVLVLLFPILTVTFKALALYSFVLGIAMGVATNLADSTYLQFIDQHNVKENGAALSGLMLNLLLAGLLGILSFLPPWTHFIVLALVTVGMGFFVLLRLHVLDGEIRE